MPDTPTKPTKGWSEKRRKQQACNARRNKPWQSATGPKSAAGKRIARMNSYKHGLFAADATILRLALRLNRDFVRHAALFLALDQRWAGAPGRKRSEEKASEINDAPPR